MKKLLLLLGLISIGMFQSCKKEGPQGPAGADGNANVKTYNISVSSANWTCSSICYTDITVAGITQDIVNSGSVHVFMESTSQTGAWLNMPWTEMNSGYISNYNFVYALGVMRISKSDSDLTTPINPGARNFKIVVIASSGKLAHPEVDYTNYEEIKEAFDIAE